MAKLQKNDLGFLGLDFQYRLVKSFVEDPGFFRDLNGVIDQNMFSDVYLRSIVGVMKEYYNKIESVPSYDMIVIKLREKAFSEEDIQYYEESVDKIRKTACDGMNEVEEMAGKFFFQQNLVKVSNELKIMASSGDLSKYEECKKLLEDALSVGRKNDDTTSPFQSIEDDLSVENIVTIPTGIDALDEGLGGGLDKGKVGLIICAMGAGKALPVDELVATPKGFVPIGDIEVGDYVIGRNGQPTKVTGVFPQGMREIYRVLFSDGTSCRCDKEHLWTVDDVEKDEPMSFSRTLTLAEILRKGTTTNENHLRYRVPMCEPVEYNKRRLSMDPYIAGYAIASGNVLNFTSMTVGKRDAEGITFTKNTYESSRVEEKHNRVTINFSNIVTKVVKRFYLEDEDTPYIPDEFIYNTVETRQRLLCGLMDASGIPCTNMSGQFMTTSKKLASQVRKIVLSLGEKADIIAVEDPITEEVSYNVNIRISTPSIRLFNIETKQAKVTYQGQDLKGSKYIMRVFPCERKEAVCIKVDAPDELYLTRDYIVTHNTSMTTCMAANAARHRAKDNDFQGYKVLQICFEDKSRDLHRKYMSNVTKVETSRLNENESTTQSVKEMLKNSPDATFINNNIKIMKLPTGEITATDIKARIMKKMTEGFRPDMVIIDYFECIEPELGMEKDDVTKREGKTMRKFENMAEELNIAIWIPTQGNRESISTDLVTHDKVGGSIRKNQIAQVVLSITRSQTDIREKRAAISILKNRTGGAGLTLNGVLFDNGTCTIQATQAVSFEDAYSYNEYAEAQRNKNMCIF